MIYPLISALTLMSKIGICIAVFVILIIIEIAALIMLVKWKKNFKPIGTQKDGADASEQTKQETNDQTLADGNSQISSDGENADKSEDKAEDTSDNADAVSEDADKDGVDDTDEQGLDADGDISDGEENDGNQTDGTVDSLDDGTDAETQSQEEDNQVEQIEETLNNMNEEKKEIDGEEQNQEDLGQVNYKEGKSSMFAFAPLMLLSAAQATTMRYALYFIIGVAVGMAVAVLGVAIAFARSFKKAPKQEVKQEQPAKQEEKIQPVEEVAQEEIAQETEQPVEDVVEEETEAVEEPTEEPIAEEAESEDAEEEIEDEEQPEDVVEDEVTVEAVEEEPEEETAEDTDESEDEDLIEKTVEETAEEIAEDTEDVSDEAVEEPVEEAVEEPAEEVKEEPKKPEPVKRTPVMGEHTVVVDSKTVLIKDDRFLFNPEEDGWYYVLEKTFTAKLIQSEDIVKDYYTELKNEILSYKKVHQRMSKKRESFNFGRNCLIRMTIRGKTLRIHFALDASDYEDTKYKVEDTSSVKSLADTPLMYRIKNDRRLKYAKDLIAAVMEKFGVEKMPISPLYLDYAEGLPYEDTPPLIERGLIIKRRVRGKMPENKGFDFAKKTFKAKLIQSDDVVKDYYSQLKNYLLSYKKIHDRMSKSRESYRFGRTCVARMSIRGKTLKLYLALDANDYVDSKYTVEDASDVKSVADTPLLIKIKNPRRLKHAMELIDAAMANVGAIKRLNADETDYTAEIPFEETDDLYDKGLITNVHVDGNSFFAQRIAARKAASEAAADEDDDE